MFNLTSGSTNLFEGRFETLGEVVDYLRTKHFTRPFDQLNIFVQGPTRTLIRVGVGHTTYNFETNEVSYAQAIQEEEYSRGMTIDSAIPQSFVNDFYKWMGEFPYGIGWGYSDKEHDVPVPLTVSAKNNLRRYKKVKEDYHENL